MTQQFAQWLRKPLTPEEERLVANLSLEERRSVEEWLVPALEEVRGAAYTKSNEGNLEKEGEMLGKSVLANTMR
jgi:hypothetical protein